MEVGDMSSSVVENDKFPPSYEVLDSLWIPNSKPCFHGTGTASMLNFDGLQEEMGPRLKEETTSNDEYQHQEKKRRLSPHQVQFLERNFEVENKLEAERKVHLAQKLGLQPRQVAIWFQNRRARYRTKQIEKEFDCLKASYHKLSAHFDAISKENEKLRHELQLLTEKLKSKEKGEAKSGLSDQILNSFEAEQSVASTILVDTKTLSMTTVCKQEDAAKSDVLDSDCSTDGNQYSSFLDEDDSLAPNLFHTLEDHHDLLIPAPNKSCNLGFYISDQTPCFWTSGLVD